MASVRSIVISGDAAITIDPLFDLIPLVAEPLHSVQCKGVSERHAKWKQSATDIVTELNFHDIVWGDVHPGNVFIIKTFDGWVMDFGGDWLRSLLKADIMGRD